MISRLRLFVYNSFMIRIAVCDDDLIFAEHAATVCRSILEERGQAGFVVDTFRRGEDLISAYAEQGYYDMVVLDIMMDGINGMDTAAAIRQKDHTVPIVFLTSTRDFAIQGYEVKALRYLMKPVERDQMAEAIVHMLAERKRKWLFAKEGSGFRRVALDDIHSLEIFGRKTSINTKNGRLVYNGKLSEIGALLDPERFVQCHQSYIVNLQYAYEIRRYEIVLFNKEIIPASRAHWDQVKSAFLRYMSE